MPYRALFVIVFVAVFGGAQRAQTGEGSACKPPALSDTVLRLWAQNTASIESPNGAGLGLVVGWAPGRAWIAVPGHVLYKAGAIRYDTGSSTRAALKIKLASDKTPRPLCEAPGAPGPFSNPTPNDTALDLAFVCVEWAGQPYFWSGMMPRAIEPGADLFLYTPSWERLLGKMPASDPDENGVVSADGLFGAEGMSGGWVGSPTGVVGLLLGKGSGGRVLLLSTIKDNAVKAEIPWELTTHETFDCRKTRQVCLVAADAARAPTRIVLRSGSRLAYDLPVGACADVGEGRYILVDPSGSLLCEPSAVLVYADRTPYELSMTCEPNLTGEWQTDDGHALSCVQSLDPSLRTAQCFGLQTLGQGVFQGNLRLDDRRLTLMGVFTDPSENSYPAEGSFEWQGGRLVGSIRRQGHPLVSLMLSRRTGR